MKKLLFYILTAFLALPAQAQTLPYQRAVLTFVTPAEWPAPNMVFTSLNVYQGGGNGSFSFHAEVYNPNTGFPPSPRGLFAGPPENFRLIAQDAAVAPGLGGAQFDLLNLFVQSHGAGGAVGFKSGLQGPGVNSTNNRAIFLGSSGTTVSLARTGSSAPGTPAGSNFFDLELPQVSQNNRAVFRAVVDGPNITQGVDSVGIWSGNTAGNTSAVVRAGIAAPAYPSLQLSDVAVPVQGNTKFAYRGTLAGAGINTDTDNVIYQGTPGNWSVVAREGEVPPGFAAGSSVFNIGTTEYDLKMSHGDKVWFTGAVNGPGINSFNNQGLWMGTPGSVQLVYREGDQAAGMPAGVRYRLNPLFHVNNSDRFVMITPVSDTGGITVAAYAYFTGSAGNLSLVASHNQQAPGTPNGVVFEMASTGFQPLISENGAVAFFSYLTGPGVTANVNDTGIWAYGNGQLQLVARAGSTVDVDPGVGQDLRVIQSLFFPNNGFADDGRLLWGATFTNGTQAAFYTLVAVPEPALLAAIPVALCLSVWYFYRRRLNKLWSQSVSLEE
jgi:hypothetical protein